MTPRAGTAWGEGLSTLIFERKSVLNSNPWAKFEHFDIWPPSSFRLVLSTLGITAGFVADELTAVDRRDAGKQRQHVFLAERLRQVVDDQIGPVDCGRCWLGASVQWRHWWRHWWRVSWRRRWWRVGSVYVSANTLQHRYNPRKTTIHPVWELPRDLEVCFLPSSRL